METLKLTEALWVQIPLAALFAIFAFSLIRVFMDQQNKQHEAHKEITGKFENTIKEVMSSCKTVHQEVLTFMGNQDLRWRESMATKDTIYQKSINDLEESIKHLTQIIERTLNERKNQ